VGQPTIRTAPVSALATRKETHDAIGEYIEIFYNRIRRHLAIGGMSPAKFEKMAQTKEAWAA
jgi:transposase InsO family protein